VQPTGTFPAVAEFGTQQPADGFEQPAGEVVDVETTLGFVWERWR
jgi:hypothetical protein